MAEGPSEGGTGQPTTGTGGLSVPIGVHVDSLFRERDKLVVERLAGIKNDIRHLEDVMKANRLADQKAVDVALDASKELAQKHNDLISAAEKKDSLYAQKTDLDPLKHELTRMERWQARATGGMMVIAAIGVANFVKLFAG